MRTFATKSSRLGYRGLGAVVFGALVLSASSCTPTGPGILTIPVVSGLAGVGQTLHTDDGTWAESPAITGPFVYSWQRCSGTCTNIAGAATSSYVVTSADISFSIRSRVTAPGASANTTVRSVPTEVVPAIPEIVAAPTLSGTPETGALLTSTAGDWTNSPSGYQATWFSCDSGGASCVEIVPSGGYPFTAGSTSYYLLQDADDSRTIFVEWIVDNPSISLPAQSALSAVITTPVPPVNTALPAINGTAWVGVTLTWVNGMWDPAGTSYTYQWLECDGDGSNCVGLGSPTASPTNLALTATHLGKTYRAQETATNIDGTVSADSNPTPIVDNPPAPTYQGPLPLTYSGGGQVAVTGGGLQVPLVPAAAWQSGPPPGGVQVPATVTYRWDRCDDTLGNGCIFRSSSATYGLSTRYGDEGKYARMTITATNAGGTVVVTGPYRLILAPPPPCSLLPPSAPNCGTVGTLASSSTLNTTITWGYRPTTVTRVWLRCTNNSDIGTCVVIAGTTTSRTFSWLTGALSPAGQPALGSYTRTGADTGMFNRMQETGNSPSGTTVVWTNAV